MGGRKYPDSDVKMLFARSAGRCAYPDCRRACVQPGTPFDRQKVIGKIAHIVAFSDNGPRGDPKMKPTDRDRYENWILLCPTCHDIVDGQPISYTVGMLREWKLTVEEWVERTLSSAIPKVTFVELETVCMALVAPVQKGSVDFQMIDIRKKIKKNSLSSSVHRQLVMGTSVASDVEIFIRNMDRLDSDYSERLKAGFVRMYAKLKGGVPKGDGLFYSMLDFATAGSMEMPRMSAGLAVLSYFFTVCDVFEK